MPSSKVDYVGSQRLGGSDHLVYVHSEKTDAVGGRFNESFFDSQAKMAVMVKETRMVIAECRLWS
jgi:hypothetical protein